SASASAASSASDSLSSRAPARGAHTGEAERIEVSFHQVAGVLLEGRLAGVDPARQRALGQLVDLLEAHPPDHRQVAFDEQLLERALGRLPFPPAGAMPWRRLEVA